MTDKEVAAKKNKPTRGRPSDYNDERAKEICSIVATSNMGLRKLCKEDDQLPPASTIYRWLAQNQDFQDQYAQAKRHQIEVFIDDITDLANTEHIYQDENGNDRCDASILRIKIDTRKWLASKLVPKVYGDRQITESTITFKHEDALKELE